jgi:hypothetical protein
MRDFNNSIHACPYSDEIVNCDASRDECSDCQRKAKQECAIDALNRSQEEEVTR